MKNNIKSALVNIAPYGIIERHRRKQRELEAEQRRIEKEKRDRERQLEKAEKERQREEARKRKEEERKRKEEERKRKEEERKRKEEERKRKEEERKQKFLAAHTSPRWGKFYADFHEKEELEEQWILYESSAGTGMTCNPYAIFKAFQKMPEFTDYIHIWVILDEEEMELLKEEYKEFENVIFVYYQGKAYSYFLAKAKYLINNTSFAGPFSKKEGQVILNTWHSITVKTLRYDTPDGNREVKNMVRNMLMADYIVSPNEFMADIFEKSFRLADVFEGKYIQEGYPGNDLVLHTEPEEIFRKLEARGTRVERGKKIILYAPTWVGNDATDPVIDIGQYTRLYDWLSAYIDVTEYQILIKPHPVVYKNMGLDVRESGYYISYGIDTNELLSVVDILITDYSGIYFGYLLTDKPILFYMPGYKSYEAMRDIYFKPEELPGPCAKDLETLAGQINHIEKYVEEYGEIRNQAKGWTCRYDDGRVSEKIIDIVFRGKQEYRLLSAVRTGKKKILIYASSFRVNGMTTAALSLLNSIDYEKYDVSLFVTNLREDMDDYSFNRIPGEVRMLIRCGKISLTEEQRRVYEAMARDGYDIAPEELPMLDYLMKREYMRCFGDSKYDYVIDFSGYGSYFACVTAKQCPQAKKLIWQHTDLKEDFMNMEKRILNGTVTTLEGLLSVYPYYDKIVSASEMIYKENKKKLATEETKDKFTYCTNLMDMQRIDDLLQETGRCEIDGRSYIKIVNDKQKNGIEQAMLIPFPYKKEETCVKFVTMGRCMPEKNHRSLILALKRLIEEGISCRLYIIGDGYMREELEALAGESGISDKVVITGFVTNPFVILRECDCFLFPSSYEAQGLAVLEARITGLPIVVSNYPAVQSVMLGDKQFLMDGTDEDAVYQGMHAYLDGKVPDDYHFNVKEYNKKAYQEFLQLLNEEQIIED